MKLNVQALCKMGIVRQNNEDTVLTAKCLFREGEIEFTSELSADKFTPMLVADGMGGHEHGELASYYLLEYLKDSFNPHSMSPNEFCAYFQETIVHISDYINLKSIETYQQKPMGSTLSGLLFYNGKTYLVNAGDSRVYRFRDGLLRQLSVDQEDKNGQLINCIGAGIKSTVQVDDLTGHLVKDDIILICSDGLSDMVDDCDIEKILSEPYCTLKELYDSACKHGGRDNVSIILIRIMDDSLS